MNDKDIAEELRASCAALNSVMKRACSAGLIVDAKVKDYRGFAEMHSTTHVKVSLLRVLSATND